MVRVVHPEAHPELRRLVCSIAQPRRWMVTNLGHGFLYTLDIKPPASLLARYPQTKIIVAGESDLEPVYDGDQPARWENCLWKPILVEQLSSPPLVVVHGGERFAARLLPPGARRFFIDSRADAV